MPFNTKNTIVTVVVLLLLVIIGMNIFSSDQEDTDAPTEADLGKETIVIGIPPWAGETFRSHVLAGVLEQAGYETEIRELDPGVVYTSLADGDLDVTVGGWLPTTHQSFWEEVGEELEIAGVNVAQTWLGLGVPDYTDESIQSISDLASADEFGEAVGYQITGIDAGAGIMQNTETAIEEYGLENWELLPSSGASMTTAVRDALSNEEPIIATVWEPHSTFALEEGNLRKLDDPESIYNDPEGTRSFLSENAPDFADLEVESDIIATVTPVGFSETASRAYRIFEQFSVAPDDDSAAILEITVEGRDAEDVAAEWLEENQETVDEWLSS